MIKRYAHTALYTDRWDYIFRHEYIQLIYLREKGFDQVRYCSKRNVYIPAVEEGKCDCSLELVDSKCIVCDSSLMSSILWKGISFQN